MPPRASNTVIQPNMGLYLDRPGLSLDPRALADGNNFRVKLGTLQSLNLGWTKFTTNWVLNGPVMMIDNFFPRNLDEQLLFATDTDIYLYNAGLDTVSFLTPRYETGTASRAGTTVTGVGTSWVANVRVGDEIYFGATGQTDPNATWHTITAVNSNTSLTTATSGTVGSGPYTIRRRFQMGAFDIWDYDTFVNDGTTGDDLWLATNGADAVISWNGIDTQVTLNTQLGFTCKTITTFSNMVIYGNLSQGGDFLPTSIINSDVGLPLNAGSTGTGLSEQFVVHDGTDGIINMIPMGDYLVIYSARHITPMQFVGDPLVFIFRQGLSGIGPVGGNAIADFGDFHTFLGADGGYIFDGSTIQENNQHIWREVIRTMDPLRKHRAFAHFDEEQGDLIWSTPLTTDADVGDTAGQSETAYVEHYLEDAGQNEETPFSKRDFPFTITGFYERATGATWASLSETWQSLNYAWNDQFFQAGFPQNIAGDSLGQIYILNEDQLADGVALPSFVRFGRRPVGSGRERGLIKRIYPFVRAFSTTLDVQLFVSDFASKAMTPTTTLSFDQSLTYTGSGEHFVTPYRRGRYWSVEFGSVLGEAWVLEGYDVDLDLGGMR